MKKAARVTEKGFSRQSLRAAARVVMGRWWEGVGHCGRREAWGDSMGWRGVWWMCIEVRGMERRVRGRTRANMVSRGQWPGDEIRAVKGGMDARIDQYQNSVSYRTSAVTNAKPWSIYGQ